MTETSSDRLEQWIQNIADGKVIDDGEMYHNAVALARAVLAYRSSMLTCSGSCCYHEIDADLAAALGVK